MTVPPTAEGAGPRVIREPPDALARSGAAVVVAALEEAAGRAPSVTLGVVGGRSVGPLFDALAAADAPWAQVHVFLADERVVPAGSDQRNLAVVEDHLTGPLVDRGALERGQVHPFEPDPARAREGVEDYGRQLERLGGTFDVVVLSAGEDGHTASLFPHHPGLDATTTFVLVEGAPKPPPTRVSAAPHVLTAATGGVLLFLGEGKRAALEAYLADGGDVSACPARLFRSVPGGAALTDLDIPAGGP